MRSAEVARFARISVRTLRHYHAIGLLVEPPRSDNGYRDYGAADLLRVLRIRQLASLGFSLDAIGGMLAGLDAERSREGGASDAARLLNDLDDALRAQIAHLQEQRDLIARLRSRGLAADYPEQAAGALNALGRLTAAVHEPGFLGLVFSEADHLALGIATHLYTAAELDEIERVFNAIVDRDLVDEYRQISVLLNELPADADKAARAHAVEACLRFLDELEDCFDADNWLRPQKDYEALLADAASGSLNEVQVDVSNRIFDAFGRRMERRAGGTFDPDV